MASPIGFWYDDICGMCMPGKDLFKIDYFFLHSEMLIFLVFFSKIGQKSSIFRFFLDFFWIGKLYLNQDFWHFLILVAISKALCRDRKLSKFLVGTGTARHTSNLRAEARHKILVIFSSAPARHGTPQICVPSHGRAQV